MRPAPHRTTARKAVLAEPHNLPVVPRVGEPTPTPRDRGSTPRHPMWQILPDQKFGSGLRPSPTTRSSPCQEIPSDRPFLGFATCAANEHVHRTNPGVQYMFCAAASLLCQFGERAWNRDLRPTPPTRRRPRSHDIWAEFLHLKRRFDTGGDPPRTLQNATRCG